MLNKIQWMFLVFIFVLILINAATTEGGQKIQRTQKGNSKNSSNRRFTTTFKKDANKKKNVSPSTTMTLTLNQHIEPEVAVDTLACPLGCICQYANFQDLPISRWINHMQRWQKENQDDNYNNNVDNSDDNRKSAPKKRKRNHIINNETFNDDADEEEEVLEVEEEEEGTTFLTNPYIKQATCILQADDLNDPTDLINRLPHDLQALILLYTGIGRNRTVNTSILKPLYQLTTLEIRGTEDLSFRLIFDEPLRFLQHANFEQIMLLGSDTFKRPDNPIHPSDSFDYRPKGEIYSSYETVSDHTDAALNAKSKLGFKPQNDEVEILPYDEYMIEVKMARMPSFYGWSHLEILRIYGCQLNELHWEMFDGLEALEHLSLERNAIETVPPFALYGALHIKSLSLAHNRIHELHYRALAGLLELEMLDLSDNKLGKLSELSFPPFPKLARVDFRNNPLRYIFPATFWIMNRTRTMHFGSHEMALELWGNLPFESLIELRELSIENVSISNLETNIFKDLHALERLKLRGKIRRIEFDAFADLTALRELDLAECGISEVSMDAFMGSKQLQVINLARNNISSIPPGLFDDQHVLEEIYLEGNQLRTLPTTFFLQPQLRLARLYENPWQCNCDMFNWRAKITNQERGPRIKRCISDYQRPEKKFACHWVDNFQFDHRYAPRCENFNGRSVFYVLRKQLQCGPGRVVHVRNNNGRHKSLPFEYSNKSVSNTQMRSLPLWRKLELRGNITATNNPKKDMGASSGKQQQRLVWQILSDQKKRRETIAKQQQQHRNSLHYVLQQQNIQQKQQTLNATRRNQSKQVLTTNKDELSNDI